MNSVNVICWDLLHYHFMRGEKKSTAYVYKLQILKRQIGSRTSSSGARLVVAVTSAALVSLVFQALPQTVMELPPLLPV